MKGGPLKTNPRAKGNIKLGFGFVLSLYLAQRKIMEKGERETGIFFAIVRYLL